MWSLVNPEGAELFDKKMFHMAMHFLSKKKQGIELPGGVPQEMLISLDPEGYFSQKQQMTQ